MEGIVGTETVCVGNFDSDALCADVEMFAITSGWMSTSNGVFGLSPIDEENGPPHIQ